MSQPADAARAARLATSPDTAAMRGRAGEAPADLLARYLPPYDLTSDLLVVLAFCPTAPLQGAFPRLPFLSLAGQTPLVLWFSRIKKACYRDPGGVQRCDGDAAGALYHELNVVALLRAPALFVAAIYATGERTIRIGRSYYGMPKQPTTLHLGIDRRLVASIAVDGVRISYVRARLLSSGRCLARLLAPLWPRATPPVRFPDGRAIRVLIQAAPRVQLAWVQQGRLALEAAWLPRAVPLLPLGLYLPDQRMQLPRVGNPSAARERAQSDGC